LALSSSYEITDALSDHPVHRTQPASVDEFLTAQDLNPIAKNRLPRGYDVGLGSWSRIDMTQPWLSGHVNNVVTQAGREIDGQPEIGRTINHPVVGRNDHGCVGRQLCVESFDQSIGRGQCGAPPITANPELMAGAVHIRPVDIRQ
jgi:hypothetical protein